MPMDLDECIVALVPARKLRLIGVRRPTGASGVASKLTK